MISDQKTVHSVPYRTSCRALGVSEAWFCKWRRRASEPTKRETRRAEPAERICHFFDRSGRTYGSPRITVDLWEEGWQVSQNTVAEIMAELGLQGRKPPRRRRSLTRPGKRSEYTARPAGSPPSSSNGSSRKGHRHTVLRWVAYAGRDWAGYLAARAENEASMGCHDNSPVWKGSVASRAVPEHAVGKWDAARSSRCSRGTPGWQPAVGQVGRNGSGARGTRPE
ncbi:IS3 family transposase [Streptomyces broussonetiae]|uniref:IS3 family transposase n=1 Tax=Streptomyces broussonetiae TaxID=2686304 RepID=UPI0035D8B202